MKLINIICVVICTAALLLNAYVVTKVTEWWVWVPIAFTCGFGLAAAIRPFNR